MSPAVKGLLYCFVVLSWRAKAMQAPVECLSAPNAELMEVLEHPVKIRNPEHQDDDDQAVEDRFDLSLHRDEPVHEPQHKPCCNNRDNYGSKRHSMFSNSFSWLRYLLVQHRRERFPAMISLSGERYQKEESEYSNSFLFFQGACKIAEQ
jgi:hypothetical protein